jgi:uncharacterized lipoprotein YddW (UPF0748 family)
MVFQGLSPWPRRAALLALAAALAGCASAPFVTGTKDLAVIAEDPPAAPREFRAAWVATVANIDWPSKPGLDSAQQQAEIRTILDSAARLKLNAIVLQVRPSADAIYPSALEPWTEYLSGEQGKPPNPLYDPLQTWIAEAHQRGIALHAWLNPYRARHSTAKSALAANHIANTNPGVVKAYGDQLWMDPAEPIAVQRTLDVVADLVRRYDLDGIHIDDYFYPYPVTAPDASGAPVEVDFPDEPAWQRYTATGGQGTRADWRRSQVNQLVQRMYAVVHQNKPWVRFGVSPFGLGKPERRAPGIQGFSQYDKLYADVELWLAQGWLDYLSPQLYWAIDQVPQAFGVLLESWNRENTKARHVWPGLFTSRIDSSAKSWTPDDIQRQIALLRQHPGASGHVHFSMVALLQNRSGLADALQAGPYRQAALVPASPWLGDAPVAVPMVQRLPSSDSDGSTILRVTQTPGAASAVQTVAIWARYRDQWRFSSQAASLELVTLKTDPALGSPDKVVVSLVDRPGQESPRVALTLRP